MNTGLWKMDSGLRRPDSAHACVRLLSGASPMRRAPRNDGEMARAPASCFERLRQLPGLLRQGPRQLALLGRIGTGGGAVDRAFGDALQYRRDAEQAVDEIKLPARD